MEMILSKYYDVFSDFILSSHYVKSHLIVRFDTILVPGEEDTLIAEVHKNDKVYVYKNIDKYDLSRIRRKSRK